MKLIEKFLGGVITLAILGAIFYGITTINQNKAVADDTTQTQVAEGNKAKLDAANKTIAENNIKLATNAKVIAGYKLQLNTENKTVATRSIKDKIDLKYLVELSHQVELLGENAHDAAHMEYGHCQQGDPGFHQSYATDIEYVKSLIKEEKDPNYNLPGGN